MSHDHRNDEARVPTLESDKVKSRPPSLGGFISENSGVKISLGLLGLIGAAMLGMSWRVSNQVTNLENRLIIEERLVRVIANKVGVEAVDLSPDYEDSKPHRGG